MKFYDWPFQISSATLVFSAWVLWGDGASVWDVFGIGFFRRTILWQSRSVVVIIVVHDHERACAGDIISVRCLGSPLARSSKNSGYLRSSGMDDTSAGSFPALVVKIQLYGFVEQSSQLDAPLQVLSGLKAVEQGKGYG